jgi:hypothetical protein
LTKPLPDSPRKFPWLPAALALAAIGADYVFVNPTTERNFYVAAMLSNQFTKVYEDPHCAILKVRDLTPTATQ